jgi:multidrug resistance efflux pump
LSFSRNRLGNGSLRIWALPSLAAVGLTMALATMLSTGQDRGQTPPRLRPPGPMSTRTPVVSAIGLVEAESQQVGLGAPVSGVAAQVNVVSGMRVLAEDALFSLDTRAVAAEVATRRADLRASESRLAQVRSAIAGLRAQVQVMEAGVDEAQAALAQAQDLVRMAEAVKLGETISVMEKTRRLSDAAIAKARLEAAQARRLQARAELAQYVTSEGADGPALLVAEAAVEQVRAAVLQAETSLSLHTVRAPFDATVLQVNIHPGEFVQAGSLANALMVLGRLDALRVRVEVEEADLPRLDPKARAWASPRGASDQRFNLRPLRVEPLVIAKTELVGAATERIDTRVLRLLYEVDAAGRTLYPGQQMDVFIAADGGEKAVPTEEVSRR